MGIYGENYIAPRSVIFFKKIDDDRKIENIHVCEKGSAKARQFLAMRDYLRSHPDKVLEYGQLKEHLYNTHPDDYPAYRAGKQKFLDDLEVKANELE